VLVTVDMTAELFELFPEKIIIELILAISLEAVSLRWLFAIPLFISCVSLRGSLLPVRRT